MQQREQLDDGSQHLFSSSAALHALCHEMALDKADEAVHGCAAVLEQADAQARRNQPQRLEQAVADVAARVEALPASAVQARLLSK
jgi:hypothetical protein